jgi:hypothetical protein
MKLKNKVNYTAIMIILCVLLINIGISQSQSLFDSLNANNNVNVYLK